VVKAGKLLDVGKGNYVENAAIWIEADRIKEAGRFADIQPHAPKDAKLIDLSQFTVLPGLIDCHTHIMARIPIGPDGYALNLATKSQAFRALEGAYDARITLRAGFTTVRDVENEGSGYADVALRDAINQGLAEGPRMQVATRAIAAVGQYNPFGVSADLTDFPTGAQMVSGVEEARRAAREQIGHGADLIKVYADWDHPTLTAEEMQVVVEEAHKQGLRVAAQCDLRVLVWPQDIGISTRQRVRCQVFGQRLCPLPMNLPIVSIEVPSGDNLHHAALRSQSECSATQWNPDSLRWDCSRGGPFYQESGSFLPASDYV
jgi:imidazolonepropionase-like amidohydrolase